MGVLDCAPSKGIQGDHGGSGSSGGLRGSGSGTAALAVAVEQGTHRGSGTIAVGPGTSGVMELGKSRMGATVALGSAVLVRLEK